MLSKFVRKSPMSTAALKSSREALVLLVAEEQRRTGSRTMAYAKVADTIGISSSWLRKFLAESHEVKEPRISLFEKIRESYIAMCERVEKENQRNLVKLAGLRRDIDAVMEINNELAAFNGGKHCGSVEAPQSATRD